MIRKGCHTRAIVGSSSGVSIRHSPPRAGLPQSFMLVASRAEFTGKMLCYLLIIGLCMIYRNCSSFVPHFFGKSLFNHSRISGWKLAIASVAAAVIAFSANAHPYASGITNNSGTISFVLNEAADDVKVVFNGGTTNDLGGLAAGVQSFALGAHTSYSIVVSKNGSGVINQISVDSTNNDFFGPRGLAVNISPKTHNFGRIYVVNASAGIGNSRPTGRGLYVLNADTSDALGYGTNAAGTNGVTLGNSTTYAPYRAFVAADDQVYYTDASGSPDGGTLGSGAVWKVTPDLTSPIAVFKFGLGGTTNFGPCVTQPTVFGDTNTGNMVLYCSMWNYTNSFTANEYTSILKYNIGSGPLPWNTIPTNYALIGASDSQDPNGVNQDLLVAPDGKFYATQFRNVGTGNNTTLWVYATDGQTLLFNSYVAGGGTDPLAMCYTSAVSPDDKYYAAIRSDGTFFLASISNGVPNFSTLVSNATTLGSTARGIAFDAADNLYLSSGGADRLQVYSLGLTTTATTGNDSTTTNGTFTLAIGPNNLPTITVQ